MKIIELTGTSTTGRTETVQAVATSIHAETGVVILELNQSTDSQWEELVKKYQK